MNVNGFKERSVFMPRSFPNMMRQLLSVGSRQDIPGKGVEEPRLRNPVKRAGMPTHPKHARAVGENALGVRVKRMPSKSSQARDWRE